MTNQTTGEAMKTNPLQLDGIEFVEFAGKDDKYLQHLFLEFGFSKNQKHQSKDVDLFQQWKINFILNKEKGSFADRFQSAHGPSICSMGWRVKDAKKALDLAVEKGAKKCSDGDYPLPAIYGIGDSIIYFVDTTEKTTYANLDFVQHPEPIPVKEKGFLLIDHLTNNVEKGTMKKWADFYKDIFGFTEVRYFHIRGNKTGLTSYALKSPCGQFCIPINEGTEGKSQINEYLEEYKGAGIQHIAFLTDDILTSLKELEGASVETLDIDDEYYQDIFDKVPNVSEDHQEIKDRQVLVDGDDDGYLLQIFTKNVVGPIFIEIIQRNNHLSFGEGNFGALFRSIERDQEKRGYLK